MPVDGEWLHVAMETDAIILWSFDDISGCFHVFALQTAWRPWMICSKPNETQDAGRDGYRIGWHNLLQRKRASVGSMACTRGCSHGLSDP